MSAMVALGAVLRGAVVVVSLALELDAAPPGLVRAAALAGGIGRRSDPDVGATVSQSLLFGSGPSLETAGNHGAPIAAETVGPAGPVVREEPPSRVAAGPVGAVSICLLDRGFAMHRWLCGPCQEMRASTGGGSWDVEELSCFIRGYGSCDDCETRSQNAPGYVTPTVQAAQLGSMNSSTFLNDHKGAV
jgi:hypothetical protein